VQYTTFAPYFQPFLPSGSSEEWIGLGIGMEEHSLGLHR
jgi:hypothetical protein